MSFFCGGVGSKMLNVKGVSYPIAKMHGLHLLLVQQNLANGFRSHKNTNAHQSHTRTLFIYIYIYTQPPPQEKNKNKHTNTHTPCRRDLDLNQP